MAEQDYQRIAAAIHYLQENAQAQPSLDEVAAQIGLSPFHFQLKVWQALLQIPAGAIISYGALASKLGQPNACRALGTAVGQNPIGDLIPCHRVLRANGEIGGYRWGTERKLAILGQEFCRQEALEA